MRMKVVDLWNQLPKEFIPLLQQTLLESLGRDPRFITIIYSSCLLIYYYYYYCNNSQLVRNSVADVISIIARITVPGGAWPNLLEFLFQCTQSDQPGHRVVKLT